MILDNEGGSPRLTKIWVQGKSYGYEFPGHGNASPLSPARYCELRCFLTWLASGMFGRRCFLCLQRLLMGLMGVL